MPATSAAALDAAGGLPEPSEAKGRERSTSLPSATRRGIEGFADHRGRAAPGLVSPCLSRCFRSVSFACAKLESPQSVTASSGDTSQCGVCFCDGGHLSAAYKGRCAAILPRSVRGPVKLALCSACGLGWLPCPRQPGTPLVSHANPHRIGTDHLRGLECIEVLQEEGRLRACS